MPDTTTTAPIAPVATDPPSAVPVVAPAAAATATPTPPVAATPEVVKMTSEAFAKRLAEERATGQRQLLGKHGVEKSEDLDARLKKLADMEAAQLSDKERQEKLIAELTKGAERAKTLEGVANTVVQELFDALPDVAKAAIEELAPTSAEDRLKYIRAFRKVAPATAATAPAAAPAPAAPVAPAPPPPTTTTPAPNAPRPGAKTKFDEYIELKAKNPNAAGLFFKVHQRAIEATRPPVA